MKDEVAWAFRGLGLSRFAARGMSRLLRGEVTDTVCRLLPGAAGGVTGAEHWLALASMALPPAFGRLASDLVPGIDENRANAAALPPMWMVGIAKGLLDRPAVGLPAAPDPAPELRQARVYAEESTGGELRRYLEDWRAEELRARLGQLLRGSMTDVAPAGWGGWAMLAALEAMRQHGDVLPEPGRRAQSPGARMAGRAFQLGRALTYAAALDLIAYAEADGRRKGGAL